MTAPIFFDRRRGAERRSGDDPRKEPRLELSNKQRRKGDDRRRSQSLIEDYTSVIGEDALDVQFSKNHCH